MSGEATTPTNVAPPRASSQSGGESDDWGERIAHELRGPAGVTLGALDELEASIGAADGQQALIAMARRGVRRVLRTAERLSRRSQLSAGRVLLRPSAVDLPFLVKRACEEAESIESRRGIRVTITDTPGFPSVNLDSDWVNVAISELVAFAIRAARATVTVSVSVEDALVRVTVSDDGRSPARPVNTGHASPERRDPGMSLWLVREIAVAHGGDLQIEAGASEGSQASLTLGSI
jgi:two-component system sensor histidine kinase EvgS